MSSLTPGAGYALRQAHRDNCVVHMVGNGELDHDCSDHQVVDYHEIDGTPTSEPCPGIEDCADCQGVREQLEDAYAAL